MMEVVWTQEALERIEDIKHYLAIEQQAPQAANDQLDRLLSRLLQIQDMPLSGREVSDYQDQHIREQLENPYRIIYMIKEQKIYLLSIMHQRQLLPKIKEMKAVARQAIKMMETSESEH